MNKKKICIVGYGAHTRNTIIPSLNLNRKNVKIVTKKKSVIMKHFQTLN